MLSDKYGLEEEKAIIKAEEARLERLGKEEEEISRAIEAGGDENEEDQREIDEVLAERLRKAALREKERKK